MGTGFAKRKKEMKQFKENLVKMEEQARRVEGEGQAGNGLVKITLSGDSQVKMLKIDPSCVDPEDVEGLEELIKAAFKDAREKLHEQQGGSEQGMGSINELLGGFQ